jgi:hypothetical protein
MYTSHHSNRKRHALVLAFISGCTLLLIIHFVIVCVNSNFEFLHALMFEYFDSLRLSQILIVTSNFGSFDRSRTYPLPVLCFNESNVQTLLSQSSAQSLGPRLVSKFPKMASHTIPVAAGYGAFVWIDSSVAVNDTRFVAWMRNQFGNADAAFFAHPSRSSVQDEIDYMLRELANEESSPSKSYLSVRYSAASIQQQANAYRVQGFNASAFPLLAGGIFIRRHAPHVDSMFDAWLLETIRWSPQDQISLAFVLWRHGIRIKVLPAQHLLQGPFHNLEGHLDDRRRRDAESVELKELTE